MISLGVLISGGGTNLQAIIDACESGSLAGQAQVNVVISNRPDAYGLTRAENAGIANYVSQSDQEIGELLEQHSVDILVLAGYLKTVSPELISHYPERIINIHPSLIPSFAGKGFYGAHVHEAAIARGVKVSGATVHLVNEILDAGEILIQEVVPVNSADTAEDLQARVLDVEHKILIEGIAMVMEKVR